MEILIRPISSSDPLDFYFKFTGAYSSGGHYKSFTFSTMNSGISKISSFWTCQGGLCGCYEGGPIWRVPHPAHPQTYQTKKKTHVDTYWVNAYPACATRPEVLGAFPAKEIQKRGIEMSNRFSNYNGVNEKVLPLDKCGRRPQQHIFCHPAVSAK